MWRDENRLLRRSSTLVFSVALALHANAQEPSEELQNIEQAWAQSTSIQFYFVSRTEKYTLTEDALKKAASIKIFRACGNNCKAFMRPVTDHLKSVKPVKCQAGQEAVLIEPSNGPRLIFSYSGRVLKVGSECYMAATGIDAVLKANGFFFH